MSKKLTPEEIQAEIANRNEIFTKATPEERRVLIAKDVLDQVRLEKIKVDTGVFTEIFYDESVIKSDSIESDSIQQLFLNGQIKSCECCALGAMMMSCTLFKNKATIEDLGEFESLGAMIKKNKPTKNGFTEVFSKEQLILIETAFERDLGYFSSYSSYTSEIVSRDLIDKAANFGERFEKKEDRLVAIMENIIQNNGTFIP